MGCSIPHSYDQIKAMVKKQIEEDRVRQLAMMNLAHQFNEASIAKDELRKAYEECRDIPQEQRVVIENFLKIESELDYEMNRDLLWNGTKLGKQIRDKKGGVEGVGEKIGVDEVPREKLGVDEAPAELISRRTRTLLNPFQIPYPKIRLTMEEIVNKFTEEGKREHEKMDAFIKEFKTTNEHLLKERNNFEIYGLSRAINKAQMEDSRILIILGRPFLATARAMITIGGNDALTSECSLTLIRVWNAVPDKRIFDASVDQSMKKPRTEEDECYRIDNLNAVIQSTA
ncbi:hypothetical protein Tco_1164963 [Tanacetum coccineum]